MSFWNWLGIPAAAASGYVSYEYRRKRYCKFNSVSSGKICHRHVADSDRWYVGHGHYDFEETLRALKETGYTGAVSVESFYFPDMVSSAKASYENMRCIMDRI